MKRTLLLAIVMISFVVSASAQSYDLPKNEIAIGAGFASHPFVAVSFGDAFIGIGDGDSGDNKCVGAYSITYLHNVNKHIAVGVSGIYEYMYTITKKAEKYSESFATLMPTARAYWFRNKSFGMYSRLAAGVSFEMYDDYKDDITTETEGKCKTLFAFHAAPVSFEVGSSKFSGFLELGYGYQGFVNAGIKFGF